MNSYSLVSQCREGFEKEALQEWQETLEIQGITTAKTIVKPAFFKAELQGTEGFDLEALVKLSKQTTVFSRQSFVGLRSWHGPRDTADRISPLCEIFSGILSALDISKEMLLEEFKGYKLHVEYPDTNLGKELSSFCKSFSNPMRRAIEKNFAMTEAKIQIPHPVIQFHVFFETYEVAHVGLSIYFGARAESDQMGSWHSCGIQHLRMPPDAPSRSTLKLEEAFLRMLTYGEKKHVFPPGTWAVDLGASPGGWTYQFLKRSLSVQCVDNGAMQDGLGDNGKLEHLRVDGFSFVPHKPVLWFACDMVESPSKIVDLVGKWIQHDLAQYFVFNLKLPMKKRFLEVSQQLTLLREKCEKYGYSNATIRAKQLYHDREEITVIVLLKSES
jgi:23S rRNA (cytidine2498-2'-O)-methyltransferase